MKRSTLKQLAEAGYTRFGCTEKIGNHVNTAGASLVVLA